MTDTCSRAALTASTAVCLACPRVDGASRATWWATSDGSAVSEGNGPTDAAEVVRGRDGQSKLPSWRWEALRTTFWLVPTLLVIVAALLFLVTFEIDRAAYHGHLTPAVLDPHRERRRRPPGAHRHRRRRHHRRRRGVLDHDPGLDPGVPAVRTPHDAQLRPRRREPGHAGRLRRHLRLLGPGPGNDHQRAARNIRAAPVDHRRRSPAAGRPGRAHLLHPPHRQVDPVARGDRRHRP